MRVRTVFSLVFLLTLIAFSDASAGGWSVVVLDELPADLVAGEAAGVEFHVLAHGHNPIDGLEPELVFTQTDTRDRVSVWAVPTGEPGGYSAGFVLPASGTWEWSIVVFEGPHGMPVLHVGAGLDSSPAGNRPAPGWWLPALLLGLAGVSLPLVAGKRFPWVYGVALSILIVAAAALGSVSSSTPEPTRELPVLDQVEVGRQLYQAKGCAACHANRRAPQGVPLISVGPDLTNVALPAEYLERWLENPAALRPNTTMPDLKLAVEDIQALVAFLTDSDS